LFLVENVDRQRVREDTRRWWDLYPIIRECGSENYSVEWLSLDRARVEFIQHWDFDGPRQSYKARVTTVLEFQRFGNRWLIVVARNPRILLKEIVKH
jgi:hypothetical protein